MARKAMPRATELMGRKQPGRCQLIERSIQKKYRKELWTPFVTAVKRYELIQAGDRIAVCISGGKDSMLLAKLMQQLQRCQRRPFEVDYLVMDPGYSPENRRRIEENAAALDIPIDDLRDGHIRRGQRRGEEPLLPLRPDAPGPPLQPGPGAGLQQDRPGPPLQRRDRDHRDGHALRRAAAGHDAQAAQHQLPRHGADPPAVLRPRGGHHRLARYNGLEFLQCACRFTEHAAQEIHASKRLEVKRLLRDLRRNNPDIEKSVFNAIHAVSLDTFPGWKTRGEEHSFLEPFTKIGGCATIVFVAK